MFYNESEIEELHDNIRRRMPGLVAYSMYVLAWRDIVNRNSDGWAYWRGGHAAAGPLIEKLRMALQGRVPQLTDLKNAMGRIKAAATRARLPQPQFVDPDDLRPYEFDVTFLAVGVSKEDALEKFKQHLKDFGRPHRIGELREIDDPDVLLKLASALERET